MRAWAFLAILAGWGCSHGAVTAREPQTPNQEKSPSAADEKRVPLSLTRLVNAIEMLEPGADDASHARIVTILRRLADVLDELRDASTFRIEKIRRIASELEDSSPQSSQHVDLVRQGLDEGLGVLVIAVPEDDGSAREKYFDATAATAKIDRAKPMLDQTAAARTALDAIADPSH
jgi:hypothetical protein